MRSNGARWRGRMCGRWNVASKQGERCAGRILRLNKKSLFLILGLLLLRIGVDYLSISQHQTPWIPVSYQVLTYLLSASIIWIERENLIKINFDGFSLIFFIVFRTIFFVSFAPRIYAYISVIMFTVIAGVLLFRLNKSGHLYNLRPEIKEIKWLLYGVVVGISIGIIPILVKQITGDINFSFYGLAFAFWFNLSNISIDEEPLFRGFIFGYLRDKGFNYRGIIILQAIIFTIVHLAYWRKPVTLLLIFIVSIAYGILAWRSRSIAPSMIAHAWFNAFAKMF